MPTPSHNDAGGHGSSSSATTKLSGCTTFRRIRMPETIHRGTLPLYGVAALGTYGTLDESYNA